jgi:flagellar hook-associated protein 3 FlgL
MLVNINRNVMNIDKLYTQYATGKKIMFPSDDPIIASRALKFRTNISQTEQYIRNTQQGLSWMNISEEGFNNTLNAIHKISELANNGATGTLEYADRQKIVESIRAYAEQLGTEMNIQYAGRYVFSGFRTDEPPVITQNAPDAVYDITQMFTFNDVERVKVYHVQNPGDAPEIYEVFRLKLPYTGNANLAGNTLQFHDLKWSDGFSSTPTQHDTNGGTLLKTMTGTPPSSSAALYQPDWHPVDNPTGNQWHFVPETGEIILSPQFVEELRQGSARELTVTYTKYGLEKGELNPRVYFNCIDRSNPAAPLAFNMDNQSLSFEFGNNTRIQVNSLGKNVYTATLYADLMRLCNDIQGIEPTPDVMLQSKYSAAAYPPPAYTDQDRQRMIDDQKREEMQKYEGVIHEMFNSMLGLIDKHLAQASKEHTALGSRGTRLELIQERLESDRLSYIQLMSENEDVDYLEVLMYLQNAQAVYTASLKAGASIAQMSLADFIR